MKSSIIMLLCIIILSGCAWFRPAPVGEEVKIDRALLKECEKLPRYDGQTDKDVVEYIGKTAKVYSDCKKDKKALNDVVKDAFKIKDPDQK
jgi:hypothetical protein